MSTMNFNNSTSGGRAKSRAADRGAIPPDAPNAAHMSGVLAGMRARRMNEAAGVRQNVVRTAVAADALSMVGADVDDRESAAMRHVMLEKRASESARLQRRIATSGTPATLTAIRPEQLNIRYRESQSVPRLSSSPPSSESVESGMDELGELYDEPRPARYPSWEEQRRTGRVGDVTTQESRQLILDPNASDMTFTSKILVYMLGGFDDMTDFVDFWAPGLTTLISSPFFIGQIIVLILDKNTRNLPSKEKALLIAKRVGVVVAVAAIESIPVIAIFPLQSFLVAFILSRIKRSIRIA